MIEPGMTPTNGTKNSRSPIVRRILSVIAGMLTGAILSVVADKILEATGVLAGGVLPMTGATLLILGILAYRTIFNAFGAFVTVKLAPDYPKAHAWVLGSLGFLANLGGTFASVGKNLGPMWYPITLTVLVIPATWIGYKIAKKQ